MSIEALSSAGASANVSTEMQVKLQKGALEQEGKVVMDLIEGATSTPRSPVAPTGQMLNITA